MVLVLVIAVYFLYRSLNRHLKRVPDSFEPPSPVGEPADPRLLLSEQPPARPLDPAEPGRRGRGGYSPRTRPRPALS